MTQTDRYSRQAEIVPAARLSDIAATVIGVGAIGRNAALQLAAIGLPRLQLIDFDVVDETNVVTQGFRQADVGQAKVTAVADAAKQINPRIIVEAVSDRFRPLQPIKTVCFCCVDSIAARAAICCAIGAKGQFWADGGMLGEVMRVLVATDRCGRRTTRRRFF